MFFFKKAFLTLHLSRLNHLFIVLYYTHVHPRPVPMPAFSKGFLV